MIIVLLLANLHDMVLANPNINNIQYLKIMI